MLFGAGGEKNGARGPVRIDRALDGMDLDPFAPDSRALGLGMRHVHTELRSPHCTSRPRGVTIRL